MRIEARDLDTGYPGHPVGYGLSILAESGSVLCLLGPNGSGKTTLFKTLLGLIPARGGEVVIGDARLQVLSRVEVARRVAYVPQAHAAPFTYSAEEIVLMGRTARLGLFVQPGERDREVARAALSRLGIADLAEADYTRLSGGQRQLVLIARALAQETPALVMDEPTASLDFGNQAIVLREIAALAKSGLTIILSTHDPDHAFAIGTRVALLHEGNILCAGSPEKALTADALSTVYGVPVQVERAPSGRITCLPDFDGRT